MKIFSGFTGGLKAVVGSKPKETLEDACPFPPGYEPPKRSGLTNDLINFYDEFLGNWKIVAAIITAASLVLAYSILNVPPPPITGVSDS